MCCKLLYQGFLLNCQQLSQVFLSPRHTVCDAFHLGVPPDVYHQAIHKLLTQAVTLEPLLWGLSVVYARLRHAAAGQAAAAEVTPPACIGQSTAEPAAAAPAAGAAAWQAPDQASRNPTSQLQITVAVHHVTLSSSLQCCQFLGCHQLACEKPKKHNSSLHPVYWCKQLADQDAVWNKADAVLAADCQSPQCVVSFAFSITFCCFLMTPLMRCNGQQSHVVTWSYAGL